VGETGGEEKLGYVPHTTIKNQIVTLLKIEVRIDSHFAFRIRTPFRISHSQWCANAKCKILIIANAKCEILIFANAKCEILVNAKCNDVVNVAFGELSQNRTIVI